MNHLPTSVRTAGIVGRATIYRRLISMAGQKTFWPTMVLALSLVIVLLSVGLAALMPHSVASDATAQHSSAATADTADAEPSSQNQTAADHSTPGNGEGTRIQGAVNANMLAVRQQESRQFFEEVAPSDVLILISEQAPGEADGDFWTRYQSLPQELQGALIIVSTNTAPQSTRLNVFVPQRFPDAVSAMSFCSSVLGLAPCELRQLHWP